MRDVTKLDRILYAPPTFLLFLLPFAHTTALRSIAFVLTVAAAIYVWRKDHPGPAVPLKIPLALWAGMALLSLAWARNPAYSLGEIRAEIGYDIVYFLAFFALTRDIRHWNLFRAALLAALTVMTGIAVWLYAQTGDLNVNSRLGGVLSISTYLVTIFPVLLVAAFEVRSDRRALGVAILAVGAALLVGYFTFNRMFILAVVACSLTIVVTMVRGRVLELARRKALAAGVTILLGASVLFFVSVVQRRAETDYADKMMRTSVEKDPRWAAWQFSVGLIRERPFSGVGFGLFAAEDLYRVRFKEGMERAITHAHNPFLNYAVQMGIGGLLVLVFLLLSLFREFWKLWRAGPTQVSLIGATGLAMFVGVLLKAQPDDLWGRHNGYLFWALTGMMLGYAHRLLREPGCASAAGST